MNHAAPLGPIKEMDIWKYTMGGPHHSEGYDTTGEYYYVDQYGNEYNSVEHVALCAVMKALKDNEELIAALRGPTGKLTDAKLHAADRLEAALPHLSQETVKVKPLVWSDSVVFGVRKWRGSGVFGEFVAFSGDLLDNQVSQFKVKYNAVYERLILSALEGEA